MLRYYSAPIRPGEVVIDDTNAHHFVTAPPGKAFGLKPRDYQTHPLGCYAPHIKAFDAPLIPRAEWADRLKERVEKKAQLSDLRLISGPNDGMIPSRDQNGRGYCWAHSGVSAHLLIRAFMGLPYADLSAYAIACIIKSYRDEGGWGAEGVEFQAKRGCPVSEFWPQQSVNPANDNAKTWANAALHKYIEFVELDPNDPQYLDQIVTGYLNDWAGVQDHNWWSHSVGGADLVSIDSSGSIESLQIRIWNSWGDSWSDKGMGVLKGRKALPDSMLFCRVVSPSPAVA